MRWTGLVAVCLILPACASSSYSPEVGPGMDGGYVEAAGIYGVEMFHPQAPLSGGTNGKGGGGLRIGYRGENDAAIEIFGDDARGFTLDYPSGEDTRVEIRSLGIAGKFYPAGGIGKVQPYLLVGAGWASVHFSKTSSFDPVTGISSDNPYEGPNDSFFLRGGVGAEFHFNGTLGAFVEGNYNFMSKHLRSFDHLDGVAGILVRF